MKGFIAVILVLLTLPAFADTLRLGSKYIWNENLTDFGGFSGIDVNDDGIGFITISDRGRIVRGQFLRADGKIIGIKHSGVEQLKGTAAEPLSTDDSDSEGLALDGKGGFYVSFEINHRVWHYPNSPDQAVSLPPSPDFAQLSRNSSLESLAIDANGTLYTLPERSGEWDRPFPVFRYQNGVWDRSLSIPRRGRYLAVGADFGPDGKFYLLERDFLWYRGFTNRIRRFDLTSAGFTNEVTLLTTEFGEHDNLEGLAVCQDQGGIIHLTMISDDNMFLLQDTEIVEYLLEPAQK